jgi:predicted nucleic acid-binding protein
MFLLDTDILVDVRREYEPAIQWLEGLEEKPAISIITSFELLRGCRNKQEQRNVYLLTKELKVIYLNQSICERALSYYTDFHLSHGLGIFDALIAATAVLEGYTLCSFNEKHYRPIRELQRVQPYSKTP